MATITSNNGKLSLTKKNKKENESGIVSNNGKLTITKKQEPKKVEDTIFVSSTPAADAVSGRKFTTTDAAGKYAASHGNNEEVAFRQKMNVDVVGERNKRDDVDEQIDAMRDLQKTYKNEMDFWGSSEFKSERYTEAEAKYNELERRIAELDRTAMSQDVIDEAQATQDAVAQYRAQQEEEKRLLNMDLQQAEEQALRLDELRELLPTYENEMDFWPEGSEKHAEAKKAYEKTKAEIAMLEQGYSWDDIDKAAQVQRKAELEQAVNYVGFDNVSKYKPTTTGRGTQNVYVNNWQTYRSTDEWGDLEYELVNKNPDAIEIEEQNRDATGSKTAGADNMYLTFMTDDEVAVYNYYYVTNKALKDEYVQMLKPELLQRQMMGRLASVVEAAESGPVGASLVSVGMTFASLPSYIGQVMDYVDDGRIETNAGYNFAPKAQKAIRDTVGENIEKKLGDKWGKVGSFAYELGMSMADFLAVAGLGAGSVGTVILGGNAAAQTTIEAKERGLSDGQALALGTISGIAEWATERYSVEKLLDMTDLGKSASGYVWKNILAEGGEEGASGLVNLLADVMISKDKSQWRQAVDAYIDRDYDEKSAFAMAVSDQVLALGLDVIGGGLSGGLMAGGGVAGNQIGYNLSRPSGQGVSQRQVMDLIARLAEEEDATQNLESATTEIPVEEIRSQAPATESTEPVAAPPGMAARAGERVVLPGSEPVLEQSGRESGASAQTIQAARRISDAIGREIIFYNAPATRRGTVNGRYENGIIYINAQSKNPLAQIISHELTHSVELAEVYERLAQTVLNRMQQSGADLDALRQNKIDLYRDNGVQLQDQKAVDAELVAEYVEKNLLTDEAQILSLVQQDRSLAQKIRDWIDSVLAKLGNEAAQERAFLTNARNLYSQALEQTTVRTQPQVQTEQVQQTQDVQTEETQELNEESEEDILQKTLDMIQFSISDEERQQRLGDLRSYLSGNMSMQELNSRIGGRSAQQSVQTENNQLSTEAQKIKNAARRQRVSVQEYLHQNWELFDVDGEWNQAAREALDNERGSRYSISEGESQLDPAVLAKELAEAGASAREIFGSTGLIVLPNGTITNPETGAIVGRYEYGQDTEANDERGVQGVRDGDFPRGREENRRNVGTGSGKTTNEPGESWEQLGGDKTRKIEQAVNSHMENAPYEGAVLYENMGAEAFSRRFYEMMLQGRPIAELWKNQIPDIQGLMEEIDGITSEDEAQYSIEDEQENLLIDDEREMAMDALLRDVERAQEEQSRYTNRLEDTRKSLDSYMQMQDRAFAEEAKEELSAAKVSAQVNRRQKGLRENLRDAVSLFKRKLVDSGEAVTRIGKTVGDKNLYHYYNMARASSNAAISMITDKRTDIYGRTTGDGLNDVLKTVRDKGNDYYKRFQLYLYHMHNIDRMSRENPDRVLQAQAEFQEFRETHPELNRFAEFQIEAMASNPNHENYLEAREYILYRDAMRKAENTRNKPVFGFEVTAENSRAIAQRLINEHPEFAEEAQKVYDYIDNLLRYRVDSGLITEEDYEMLKSIYPHYIPTYRSFEQDNQPETKQRGKEQVGKTIQRATGGDAKLMPLHKALSQQTMSVVREGSKNRFGQRLMDDNKNGQAHEHIYGVEEYDSNFSENTFDRPEDEELKKTNTFVVRQDGRLWEITVSPALYEAVQALSPTQQESNAGIRLIRNGNDLFKALVTGYNPTFLVRNFVRDIQDAGLYSKDLSEFAKQYPQALREMAKDGKYWKQYKALGGTFSSVFDYETGETNKGGKIRQNTVGRIEALNSAVEQAPRLAEFMATVKKAEKDHGEANMDDLMEAMYNAADVTVNFGRSGTLGKWLNSNVVPFLNPGIQGFSKMVRSVTETKGAKDWARLAVKAAVLGIAPMVINSLIYHDDDEWDALKDRDKDVYYLFKIRDGLWLKLPKGRTLSLIGMTADRAIDLTRGEDVDWGGFIETAAQQSAPANPFENNIAQAWIDTKLFDSDNPGETWYGTDIESQRLQNYAPGERYDASTDVVSKWLGKTFNLSPAKINYLLDQYTGVVGDIMLPLLSPQAERDIFSAAFTIDSVYSNRFSNDFYEMADELTYQKNMPDATGVDNIMNRFWSKQSSAVSDVNKAIREIEADTELKDKDKKELTAAQYGIRNALMENALNTLEEYREAAERSYNASTQTKEDDRIDEAYREANREVFGAEYALQTYNKSVYDTATEMLQSSGISYEDFYDFYFAQQGIDATGYEKTNEKRNLIMQSGLTDEQKEALYTQYISDTRTEDIQAFRDVGMNMDTFMKIQNEYAAIDNMNLGAAEKRVEFSRWLLRQSLTAQQDTVAQEVFSFYSHISAKESKYEKFIEAGLSDERAYEASNLLYALEPLEGKTSVSAAQQYKAVADAGWSDEETLKAFSTIMGEKEYARVVAAESLAVSPKWYAEAKFILPQYDENENGSYSNAEIEAAIDAYAESNRLLRLDNGDMAILWQALTGSTSAKNNPYSRSVGQDYLDRLQEE